MLGNHIEVTLHACSDGSNKFRYISKHEWPKDNFSFRFIKGRNSDFFNEHNVKLIQAGGYIPLQIECTNENTYNKIILFLPPGHTDMQEFKDLSFYHYLNIYQSYFESSLFSYILEFFAEEQISRCLLQWLKTNNHTQNAGKYQECMLLHE